MRNLKPAYIVLGGSLAIGLFSLILLVILNSFLNIHLGVIILSPLIIAVFSYITFYIFIKIFITEKLKILYRSIRKGKFQSTLEGSFSLQDDVIAQAEIETKNWTDEKISEISKLREQEEFRREFLGNLAHE
ncbi:MAG: sensor histidine kinase, partial [Crocinitomicaceae bacterium]|nr:sensor histidine kinase [Crocinitomicaceae bacterium]